MHKTCPDGEETIKWGFPHFDYLGSIMCSIASFKKHCAITFWKASLMKGAKVLLETAKTEVAMGHLGKIQSKEDLPKDALLIKYIKEAMVLNERGLKVSTKKNGGEKKEIIVPDYFSQALSKNKKALKTFNAFSTSNKKEYIVWVDDAKTESTRLKRLEEAIEWMSEEKIRNWKYLK